MLKTFKLFEEIRGTLVPIEFASLPFEPRRVFYVYSVPKGEERGMHAHYKTEQILICIKGQIKVKLHDGEIASEIILNPNDHIYIGKMVWDSQVFLTGEDVLLSLCSTKYDKLDYIEDFFQFVDMVKTNRSTKPIKSAFITNVPYFAIW